MEIYSSGEFSIEIKQGDFPLTRADTTAHKIISEHLSKTNLPILSEEGANIEIGKRMSWEYFWLIDPLDGTKEFINKNGEFTINIALVNRNFPIGGVIYAPISDNLYYGSEETGIYKTEKGKLIRISPLPERKSFHDLLQREHLEVVASRSHMSPETKAFLEQFKNVTLTTLGSALKFMRLLENRADIYPRLGTTMEWDTAAAHAILNASNRGVYHTDLKSELIYNKLDLRNPFFIAF
jgi:3'(2'), 5'-bisphosphate nucleotidase